MIKHFEIEPRYFTVKNKEYTVHGYTQTDKEGYVEATFKGFDGEQHRVTNFDMRKQLMDMLAGRRRDGGKR